MIDQQLHDLLILVPKQNASDLHLQAARFPTLRVDGELVPLVDQAVLTRDDVKRLVYSTLSEIQTSRLEAELDLDYSLTIDDKARFRVNAYFEKGNLAAAFRYIPYRIKTIEELNLPPVVHQFSQYRQGLVLVVGPAGMGKSTTMAAIVDEMNHSRPLNIVTIEEPIEYLFTPDKCMVSQREVGIDALSWAKALRASLREDPDVLMVGEMRDLETISTALTAAETGHFVISTLHTATAAQTIDRIIDVFPAEQQNQTRFQLTSVLLGTISQRLVPRIQGGRIPAVEVMFANPAIRTHIREKKTYQIDLVIETSLTEGMISLNRSLSTLVKAGHITPERAIEYSANPEELKNML